MEEFRDESVEDHNDSSDDFFESQGYNDRMGNFKT